MSLRPSPAPRRPLVGALPLVAALLLAPPSSPAASYVRTTSSGQGIYAKADESSKVATLPAGTVMAVRSGSVGQKGWIQVAAPDCVDCWIPEDFIKDGAVSVSMVRVRSSQSPTAPEIARLQRGESVVERGRKKEWVRIAPPPSASLWVKAESVSATGDSPAPTTVREPSPVEDLPPVITPALPLATLPTTPPPPPEAPVEEPALPAPPVQVPSPAVPVPVALPSTPPIPAWQPPAEPDVVVVESVEPSPPAVTYPTPTPEPAPTATPTTPPHTPTLASTTVTRPTAPATTTVTRPATPATTTRPAAHPIVSSTPHPATHPVSQPVNVVPAWQPPTTTPASQPVSTPAWQPPAATPVAATAVDTSAWDTPATSTPRKGRRTITSRRTSTQSRTAPATQAPGYGTVLPRIPVDAGWSDARPGTLLPNRRAVVPRRPVPEDIADERLSPRLSQGEPGRVLGVLVESDGGFLRTGRCRYEVRELSDDGESSDLIAYLVGNPAELAPLVGRSIRADGPVWWLRGVSTPVLQAVSASALR